MKHLTTYQCLCGHMNRQHEECSPCEDASHGEAFHFVCKVCGCANLQVDHEYEDDREANAKQLQWDADHDK